MNPRCKVCTSKCKKKIEQELLLRTPYRLMQQKYGFTYRSLYKHKHEHMSAEVVKSMKGKMPALKVPKFELKKEFPQLKNLGDCLSFLHNECLDVNKNAIAKGDEMLRLQAIRQDRECLGLAMRGKELLLSYQSQGSWEKIFPIILKAVDRFPEAKIAIAAELKTSSNLLIEDVLK